MLPYVCIFAMRTSLPSTWLDMLRFGLFAISSAAETTNFPNHVVEMALAHTISDRVEAAYRRGDLFEKRRKLTEQWSAYCSRSAAAKIVPLRQRG